MNRPRIELYVGLFVIFGLVCTGYLISVIGGFSFFSRDQYSLHGYFSTATGLKPGAGVEMAGVHIGVVESITLDRERYVAKVAFKIDKTVEISEDSIAAVKTAGIIGEKFLDISPGGEDTLLEDGDEIYNTESSLDIESLVRKFIFSNE